MRALFVSDLHLTESRAQANEQFISLIEGEARAADALYVLGDLFEYWIGDDDLDAGFNAVIASLFSALTRRGTKLYVMHGNRDFLLGGRFCQATGAKLIEDPALVDIDGERTLLMHGDTLCTDDLDYQAWRRTARSHEWQAGFLAKSVEERRAAVEGLRDKSKEVIQAKPAEIMDVNDNAVREAFRRWAVSRMVHGHTHRPGRHVIEVDGRRCERWVLPDWYAAGGYLEIAGGKPRLVRFK